MDGAYKGRTALVTGASAGIGREYCRRLAAAGADIVAVARRSERLADLAATLHERYGVTVTPITLDLSRPDAPDDLIRILNAGGVEIDILINNAGYGVPGRFLSSEWRRHADFTEVMMTAVARLCYLTIPGMCERGYGVVVNVASIAGFLPGTCGHTLYGAAKAWMINFSESLALEYGREGVKVCAVCPGFTRSEFHDVTGTRARLAKMPSWMWMSADDVVAGSLRAVECGVAVYIPGRVNRLIVLLARWLPRRVVHALARRESHRFRDET